MFRRHSLSGSRILLTGASGGIGWALAQCLSELGVRLVLASRSIPRLDSLVHSIRSRGADAVSIPTDVADAVQRGRLIERTIDVLGGLDILINNAGVGAYGFFADAGEARLRRIFEVNFFGCTELTRLAIPHLRQGNNPILVNIGSVIGRRAIPGCTEYCSSKFALSGWSEGLRPELARLGIHVLLVSPGVTATDFRRNVIEGNLRFNWQNHGAMPADRCARLIARAMQRRKNEIVLTYQGKALVWLNRLAPRLLDRLLARYAR